MKFKLLFIIANLLFINVFAQQNYPWAEMAEQNNADYFNIITETDSFYKANENLKDAEGSSYKKYLRWKTFWENRVDENGDCSQYSFKISEQYKNSIFDYDTIIWKALNR